MNLVFADTLYWIAIFIPGDPWSKAARQASLDDSSLITTEEVLAEFLTAVSRQGEQLRRLACKFVREIVKDPSIEVIEQSHESFLGGLTLYEKRSDKQYNLTDCISMNAMRRRGIKKILTADHHFSQEGFVRLLNRTR